MSSDNCIFMMKGSDISIDEIRKDRYIFILVSLDPDDPDGLKLKEEIQKLSNTKPEEVYKMSEHEAIIAIQHYLPLKINVIYLYNH